SFCPGPFSIHGSDSVSMKRDASAPSEAASVMASSSDLPSAYAQARRRSTRFMPQLFQGLLCAGPPVPAHALLRLERDAFSSNRHLVLVYWWPMIFSDNRYPLFGIMR